MLELYAKVILISLTIATTTSSFRNRDCSTKNVDICALNGNEIPLYLVDRLLCGHNKFKVPSANSIDVSWEIRIESFGEITGINSMITTMDTLFIQEWIDVSLNFAEIAPCMENVTIGADKLDEFFIPDVVFINSQHVNILESPTTNKFALIWQNGTFSYDYRTKITGTCDVYHMMFPFDAIDCEVRIETNTFNIAQVRLIWADMECPVSVDHTAQQPNFKLQSHSWSKSEVSYKVGTWDQLLVSLTFKRYFGFYITQMYLPAFCMVTISWVSFWIDRRALPARFTLSVSSLMSLVLQYGNVSKLSPMFGYYTSFDVWMFGCVLFIVLSLFESALVDFLDKMSIAKAKREHEAVIVFLEKQRSFRNPNGFLKRNENRLGSLSVNQTKEIVKLNKRKTLVREASTNVILEVELQGATIDYHSRWLFPLVYLILNVIYWIIVTGSQNTSQLNLNCNKSV